MPFSMAVQDSQSYHILQLSRVFKKIKENKNKKIVTLQVRILSDTHIKWLADRHGKKVFLSVSGALTLEAAMCLTLFVFASVCLILPMKVMNTERKIQAAMEMIGEDYSRYAYLQQSIEQGKALASVDIGNSAKEFSRYLAAGAGVIYAQEQISDRIDTQALEHANMLRSRIMTDNEMIDLIFDYELRLPFPVLGMSVWKRSARCRRRAWVGMEGKDYRSEGNQSKVDGDMRVYIGKDSTRYHKDRNCHYLSNRLTAVSKEQVKERRNESGRKYRSCSICGDCSAGIVYILPNGESYHSEQNCRAIMAYVRTAKLSEVEHLGPCSYCSR